MKIFHLFFFLIQFGYSQQSFHEEWYSAELENIPQNTVKSIAPDKYGFIWMTTENGLLRFDGINFKVFNSGNSNLLSNRFAYLTGNIQNDSLKTHTAYYVDEILINKRGISKTKKSSNYNTFTSILTYEDLLYFHDNLNDPTINFKNTEIKCDNGNYYLIGNNKISLYDKNKKILKEVKQRYKTNTLYFLQEDELVLLNYKKNHYSLFENNFLTTYKLAIPEKSKVIYNPIVQQLFVCSKNEILLLNKIKNKIHLTPIFYKPKININIKSLYFDKKNSKLFIGTIDKGLNVISLSKFKLLLNPTNQNNIYYGNFPISKNEFVTSRGEIFNINGLVQDLKVNLKKQHYSLTVDKQKNIWFIDDNVIKKYLKSSNYKVNKTFTFKYKIATIYCDSKNKIWIGMEHEAKKNANIFTIDANLNNAALKTIKNLNKSVVFFAENQKHEMLMVCEKELLIYNSENQKTKSIPSGKNEIRSLFIGKDNTVWVCTYNNGFSLLKNNTLYKMPFDSKMYLLSAHCIKEDSNGHFWISTNKGLIEVAKQSLLNYHKNKTPVYFHHYNIKNGFLTNEFNGGCQPCAIELDNQFIFPSLHGVVAFNPENIRKIIPSNNFYVNEVELDGKTTYFKDTLHIDRNINRVKFKVDFAYFGNQDNVFFNVKLDLKNNDNWINLPSEKEISYTNLPPGSHSFYVKKIKAFSSEFEVKTIVVSIPYLFYETIIFKIFVGFMSITLLLLGIKLRYRIIRKKNDDLEDLIKSQTSDLFKTVSKLEVTKNNLKQEISQQKKLIGTISHDIKSPLKFLSITAKHVYEKSLLSENENIKFNAKVMQESASELYRFVDNLVDYSKVFMEHQEINKSKKDDINLIILEKINLFKNAAVEKNILITFNNFAPNTINLNKQVLGIIIHNLLDNAIKNTIEGSITIEAKIYKNKTFISVEDTGIGMSKEIEEYYTNIQKNYETDKLALQNYGLGLHMVLELLRLTKGDLKIKSKEQKGTKITIILDN